MFDVSNYSTKFKYYDELNKSAVGKMKEETAGVAITEFAGLKPKMYSFLVDDSGEHKKAKGVNKNVDAAISHNDTKMFYWIRNVWSIRWIESRVNIIE